MNLLFRFNSDGTLKEFTGGNLIQSSVKSDTLYVKVDDVDVSNFVAMAEYKRPDGQVSNDIAMAYGEVPFGLGDGFRQTIPAWCTQLDGQLEITIRLLTFTSDGDKRVFAMTKNVVKVLASTSAGDGEVNITDEQYDALLETLANKSLNEVVGKDVEEYLNQKFEEKSGLIDEYLEEQTSRIENEIDTELKEMDDTIKGLGDLKPSGTAPSSSIISFKDNVGIYIGEDDGNWYYWKASEQRYVVGGSFQSDINAVDLGEIIPESTIEETMKKIHIKIEEYTEIQNSYNSQKVYMILLADTNGSYGTCFIIRDIWTGDCYITYFQQDDIKKYRTGYTGDDDTLTCEEIFLSNIADGSVTEKKLADKSVKHTSFTQPLKKEYDYITNNLICLNLINPSECLVNKTPNFINNQTLITDDTAISSADKYVLSNVIYCKPGDKFIFNKQGWLVNFYGATLVNGQYVYNSVLQKTFNSKETFEIPNGCYAFRYRFTISSTTDTTWETSVMLARGESLSPEFVSFGTNFIPNLYETKQNAIVKSKVDASTPQYVSTIDKMCVMLVFDGMNENTYDKIIPYLVEKNLPITLYTNGNLSNELIGKYLNAKKNYGIDIQFYNGHPSTTYEGTNNYLEQYNQFKTNYDNYIACGFGKPKFLAYSGGRHTSITENIAKQFGFKWGRTTDATEIRWQDDTFNTPCLTLNDNSYDIVKSFIDEGKYWKIPLCFLSHSLKTETQQDDYLLDETKLKGIIDLIASYKDNGSIYCMTMSQFYEYLRFPKDIKTGVNVLMYEADNEQHLYVKTDTSWKELTY